MDAIITLILGGLLIMSIWILVTNSCKRPPSYPPGPPLKPIVGNLSVFASKDILQTFKHLQRDYGVIFSLCIRNKDLVVINSLSDIKEIFVKHGDVTSSCPDTFFFNECLQRSGIIGSSGHLWKEHRKFALSNLGIFGVGRNTLEKRIMNEIETFLQKVEEQDGIPYMLNHLLQTSVTNIIGSIVYDKRFDHNDAKFLNLVKFQEDNSRLNAHVGILTFFPFLKYLPGDFFSVKRLRQNYQNIYTFFQQFVEEHKNEFSADKATSDFIDAYLKEKSLKKDINHTFSGIVNLPSLRYFITDFIRISKEKKISSCSGRLLIFFVVGMETTVTTLRWAILFLLHNPDVQDRIRQEIDNVVGSTRYPSLSDHPRLPFCEAVVVETLRCGKITALSGPHCAEADISINGYVIPKGATLLMNLDSVLMDPILFEEPEKFDPSRFIDKNGELSGQEKVIIFSVGRRVCLGESLARMELFLFITALIQRFVIEPVDSNNLPPIKGKMAITFTPENFYIKANKRI